MKEDNLISLVLTLATFVFIFVFLNFYTIQNKHDLVLPLPEIVLEVENIEIIKEEEKKLVDVPNKELKNFSQSVDDERKTDNNLSKNSNENISVNKKTQEEEIVVSKKIEVKTDDIKISTPSKTTSEFKYEGNVMVQWGMDGRLPYDNNSWYIRNPGYMCGIDEDGLLYLDIIINEMGEVTDVKINKDKSVNLNTCIIKHGVEYAKISKFSSGKNKQKGFIIYKFVGQ